MAITYSNKPVALAFNASGAFARVLEQREKHDLIGKGWHEGGRFDDRDGHHRDTIAISTLPGVIKTYFASNYPNDTLKNAFINRDSSYLVVSANAGIFFNTFTSAGSFIKRTQVYPRVKIISAIAQTALPASITTYLNTTYPAYVFNNALVLNLNGTAKGYLVFINANNVKYAIIFDDGGTFVQSITIR